jgi:hypothetical protein
MSFIKEVGSWKVEILPETDGNYRYECYQGVEQDRIVIKSESIFPKKKEAEDAAYNAIKKLKSSDFSGKNA